MPPACAIGQGLPRRKHKPCVTLCAPCLPRPATAMWICQCQGRRPVMWPNPPPARRPVRGRVRLCRKSAAPVRCLDRTVKTIRACVLWGPLRRVQWAGGRRQVLPSWHSMLRRNRIFPTICCSHGHNYCKHIGYFSPSGTTCDSCFHRLTIYFDGAMRQPVNKLVQKRVIG